MSNQWLNIRFGMWHLHAEGFRMWWSKNPYYAGEPFRIEVFDAPWKRGVTE